MHTPEQILTMALAEPPTPFIVEKDCGCTSTVDLNWWLRTPGATLPLDVSVLDTCLTALTLARAVGVPCELADVWTYRPAGASRTSSRSAATLA